MNYMQNANKFHFKRTLTRDSEKLFFKSSLFFSFHAKNDYWICHLYELTLFWMRFKEKIIYWSCDEIEIHITRTNEYVIHILRKLGSIFIDCKHQLKYMRLMKKMSRHPFWNDANRGVERINNIEASIYWKSLCVCEPYSA